uniref:Ciliary microtubule associated protein 3 n=1 Tax=Sphenodon punctatus TaxID=8508 RepID=A0A8D0GX02_SPHPU
PLAAQKRNAFGSCQERKIFPLYHAPDRLGNELAPVKGDPVLGPGTYNIDEVSFASGLPKTSIKGYAVGARTATRFPPDLNVKGENSSLCFSLFRPGTYIADKLHHRHVTWPMKFGSPDWSMIPTLERRALRTELLTDLEFRKHRNRVAYLSLYYS